MPLPLSCANPCAAKPYQRCHSDMRRRRRLIRALESSLWSSRQYGAAETTQGVRTLRSTVEPSEQTGLLLASFGDWNAAVRWPKSHTWTYTSAYSPRPPPRTRERPVPSRGSGRRSYDVASCRGHPPQNSKRASEPVCACGSYCQGLGAALKHLAFAAPPEKRRISSRTRSSGTGRGRAAVSCRTSEEEGSS